MNGFPVCFVYILYMCLIHVLMYKIHKDVQKMLYTCTSLTCAPGWSVDKCAKTGWGSYHQNKIKESTHEFLCIDTSNQFQ